jgi:hypothetical protein
MSCEDHDVNPGSPATGPGAAEHYEQEGLNFKGKVRVRDGFPTASATCPK